MIKIYGDSLDLSKDVWVGIDQSYTGFAVTLLDVAGGWKSWVYKAEGRGVERLENIRGFLTTLFNTTLSEARILDVAMEGYSYGSKNSLSHMLGELGGLVKSFCYTELDIRPIIVPPTSLKKYVVGKGTGVQKNQILLYVFKKWNVEFKDDNAADSYALAQLASGQGSLEYEKEIYNKLKCEEHRA